jgi:4-aminobutyrate aminotransferase/(S)-3-amino-2-methylpropionate transaminase
VVEQEQLCARAVALGNSFSARAERWQKRWAQIGALHGMGAMRALEMVRGPATGEPDEQVVAAISKYCYENGLLTISAGTYGNILRLLMPLVITDAQFEEGLDVLEAALTAACG